MKAKNSDVVYQANRLTELRSGAIKYNEIKKTELWDLLHLLMERPALGLADIGDQDSFNAELKRIFEIFLSVDGITVAGVISKIGGSLNYDTLLCFNQIVNYYLTAISVAREIIYQKPGEIEALTDRVKEINEQVNADPTIKGSEVKMEVSAVLFIDLFHLALRLTNQADSMLKLLGRVGPPPDSH